MTHKARLVGVDDGLGAVTQRKLSQQTVHVGLHGGELNDQAEFFKSSETDGF